MRHSPWIGACATWFFGASPVWACPLCRSDTGRRVRAGIFNADFGENLLVTLLPFLVFLAVVAWIHFGLPRSRGKSRQAMPSVDGDTRRARAR
jgi:hypothetical protein